MTKVLRPGDQPELGYRELPERPEPIAKRDPEIPETFVSEYNATPAATVKERYNSDPVYRRIVDFLMERGAI